MCSNPRTRSSIKASSDARARRRAAARPARYDTVTSPTDTPEMPNTNAGRKPPSNPWSKTCWIRTGETRFATVAASETTTVRARPLRSAGLSWRPCRRTLNAPRR
jgi:hypothetical protein